MRFSWRGAAPFLGAACALPSALAVDIYAPDNLGNLNGGTVGDRLIRFDSNDPSNVTVIGDMGVAGTLFTGMDFSSNGTLYAYARDKTVGGLFSVSTSTGATTFIGRGGVPGTHLVGDMAWDPVAQQMLLVSTNTVEQANLYTVSLTTGVATLLGPITSPSQTQFIDVGLAVDSQGNRYIHDVLSDQIFKLSGLTATALPVPLGYNSNFSQGLTIDWSRGNQGYHGAFNQDDGRSELYTWNTTTGAETFIGNIGPIHSGGVISEYEPGDVAIPPVPEPASVLLVLSAAALVRRR